MNVSLICGISMIGIGFLGPFFPFTLPGLQSFYTTSPMYVLLRLGCVLVVFALLYRLERTGRKVPGPIQLAGQESLLVYGLHLWVIFGFLRGEHLGPILGMELGYAACFALSVVLVISMLGTAKVWQKFKNEFPRLTRWLQGTIILSMLLLFLSR